MNLGIALMNVERTWVRRGLLVLYVVPGIALSILLSPVFSVKAAYHYSRMVWSKK